MFNMFKDKIKLFFCNLSVRNHEIIDLQQTFITTSYET